MGRKDLYLVRPDLILDIEIDVEIYKERKYLLTKWRNEKADELKLPKELFLSSYTIQALARNEYKNIKIPIIPGLDVDFIQKYQKDIGSIILKIINVKN